MPKEEEPIAGMQEPDVLIPGQLRQEGDGRVEQGRGDPLQTGEFPVEIAAIGVAAEEAF